jgi:hypothetical protein
MQSKQVKQAKNRKFEIPSEQETKRLKTNKHKIQEDNAKMLGNKEMKDTNEQPCLRRGDGGCKDLGDGT